MQDAHHGWCGSKCPLLQSVPRFTFPLMNYLSSDHMANILVHSSLKMHKFVDVWWTLCRTRRSSCGKICMFSGWVFRLSQKAVQMLFEDWLECKACSSTSFEYVPCEFFSPLQQLFTCSNFSSGLLVDCFMLRFSLPHTLRSSWRGQTS